MDDADQSLSELVLPPEASFARFFELHVIPEYSDDSVDHQPGGDPGPPIITAFADGAFEAHLPPGRYDVEAVSRDGLLIGGLEALRATPGAAETGLELRLEVAAVVEGRVVDEDGVPVLSSVALTRKNSPEAFLLGTGSDSTFRFEGLRRGLYNLAATAGDDSNPVEIDVTAPRDGIEVRVPRATHGMLVLPRSSDGKCPRGILKLIRLGDKPDRGERRLRFVGCSAILRDALPGSAWQVSGTIAGRAVNRQVQFDLNRPPTPVCLDFPCDPFVAAVDIWIFDADGSRDEGTVRVLSTPYGGPAVGTEVGDLVDGLPGAGSLTLGATVNDQEVTTTVSLRPGVNRAVLGRPKRR